MLVIATSLACATFKLAFVGLIFVVAIAALLIQSRSRRFRSAMADGTIVVTVQAVAASREDGIGELLRQRLQKPRLESVSSTDGQTVLCYNFQGASEAALLGLKGDLGTEGLSYSVFFNRTRAL